MHTYGRVPSDPSKPRVRFSDHVYGGTAPAAINWGHDPQIGMHLNDTWGDCVWGGIANRLEIQSFYATGRETAVPDSDVLAGYETTGFSPSAGPPGDNPTDNGTQLIDGLKYAARTGMAGMTIAAYAELNVPGSPDQLRLAIAELGPALMALNLPDYAEQQFQTGNAWTVQSGGTIVGGHCVLAVGYDTEHLYIQTWNALWPVAWDFVAKYFDEGWAIYSPLWSAPAHVSVAGLLTEFQALAPKPGCFLRRALDWLKGLRVES